MLVAVRDNEPAAAAAGVRVVRTKLLAFALSGFMAGVAPAEVEEPARTWNE